MLGAINRFLKGSARSQGEIQALVVGLGNPGDQYRANRHNVGFMALDAFSERCESMSFRQKFQGLFAKTAFGGQPVILIKPQTYMNRSGSAVAEALHFYNLNADKLIVVHDELDLDFGVVRVKQGGGSAGHKGIKSIMDNCGSGDFVRVRLGIGRPPTRSVEQYVLSDFAKAEQPVLTEMVAAAASAIAHIMSQGPQSAMNRFNVRGSAQK